MKRSSGTTISISHATAASTPTRQPTVTESHMTSGMKMICPTDIAVPRMPLASPRRSMNQRFATVADRTAPMPAPPAPTTTPQYRSSCQTSVITVVASAPIDISVTLTSTTTRGPERSMMRPTIGPARPNSSRLIATASVMDARSQPNSASNGRMSTPGHRTQRR